jgi:peptidoglycan hydrolase-like protein with peptidoglycan-binding domain
MHFEVGDDLIRQWHAEGRFGPAAGPAPDPVLSLGDRGPEVRELQQRLNGAGASLRIDGDFGPATEAAVKAFQQANGLTVDGIVGPATREKLGIA